MSVPGAFAQFAQPQIPPTPPAPVVPHGYHVQDGQWYRYDQTAAQWVISADPNVPQTPAVPAPPAFPTFPADPSPVPPPVSAAQPAPAAPETVPAPGAKRRGRPPKGGAPAEAIPAAPGFTPPAAPAQPAQVAYGTHPVTPVELDDDLIARVTTEQGIALVVCMAKGIRAACDDLIRNLTGAQ